MTVTHLASDSVAVTVVTCGDSAAGQLRAAGLAFDVIVWRDILHEGPVPGGVDLDELARIRAGYLASMGWAAPDAALRDFLARDERLAAAAAGPLYLWFDDNLVNQLQLLQILAELAALSPNKVYLAGPRTFGGASSADLHGFFERRRPVTPEHFDAAIAGWTAFRAADPESLNLFSGGGDWLPALGPALQRHLRQYPSTRDGLGQTERRGLEAVAAGLTDFVDIFLAHGDGDDPPFMGDTTFRHYLERLARGPQPLLSVDGGGGFHLTEAGARVLDGEDDQCHLNSIDRWFGGVHLTGCGQWRWDESQRQIVSHDHRAQ